MLGHWLVIYTTSRYLNFLYTKLVNDTQSSDLYMYLEPVELRDYIASQLTTPHNISGSVELSENGLVFKSQDKDHTVFTVPKQSIHSVATDERKYYSVSEVLGYGVFLILIAFVGTILAPHTGVGYLILGGAVIPLCYLLYQYYNSHSHVLIIQTSDEILEFEISEQQKEEAANYIEFAEEL